MLGVLRTSLAVVVVSTGLSAAFAAAPGAVSAQSSEPTKIGASPKGTVGLGLVGAELGLVLPAAFGLTDLWATIVFPVVGAGGGAAAGYFLIDDGGQNDGALGVAMMTTGLVLVIPSVVLAVSLGRYDPDADMASAAQIRARMSPEQRARADAGPGLLRMSQQGVFVAPPAIEVGRDAALGGGQRVRMAVLSGSF